MGLLDMCCPKKPKKSLDYVIKWVEDTDKTIKYLYDSIEEIKEMDLQKVFDDYARDEYDWSQVPEFDAKADKVENAINGHLAALDSNGNLQDSGLAAGDVITNIAVEDLSELDNIIGTGVYHVVVYNNSGITQTREAKILFVSGLLSRGVYQLTQYLFDRYSIMSRRKAGTSPKWNEWKIINIENILAEPDDTPTEDSQKLITSGGVKAALDARANGLIRSLYFVIPSGSTNSPSRLADWVDSTHKVFDYALELPASGSVTVKAIGGCYAYGGLGYEDTDLGEVNVTKVIANSPSPVAGQRVSWNIYDELIAAGDTAYGSVDYVKDIVICVEISEALQSDKMFVLSVLPYINSEA